MSFQRVHQSRSQNPQTSSSTSQFAPRPFPVQEPKRTSTQEELENQVFQQNKFEATGLQLKEKYGTITPVEQERLGVLQAKVDDFWAQRLERASRFGHNFANVPVHAPSEQVSAPIQPQFATRLSRASVSPLIQAKLTVGQVNDRYEQEADRVAEQVMRMAPPATPNIQHQAEEEQEELQTKPLVETIMPIVQRQEALEEEPIQAKCENCEEEEQVQRSSNGVPQVQADLENRLNASKGGGSPLPDEVRSYMEPRFGADFRDVRVHTDGEALQMSQELNANAFTHKNHIYFGSGKFPGKDALTAHELTHVVQQKSATQQPELSMEMTALSSKQITTTQHKTGLPVEISRQASDNQIFRHTKAECDELYEECGDRCRSLPNRTRRDKMRRALCWAQCMEEYATCLTSSEEALAGVLTVAAIVAAIVLASADGPAPIGDAAAIALLISLGII